MRFIVLLAGLLTLVLTAAAQSLTITTIAGQPGESGSADGTGSAAQFYFFNGMVADASGNLYLLDDGNYTVRKVTSAGEVTTIAGAARQKAYVDGTGTAARFYQPSGLALDAAGNLYLSDFNPATVGPSVRKITPGGVVTTYLSGFGGPLAFDAAGNLIVLAANRLRAFVNNVSQLPPTWPPGRVENVEGRALTIGRDGSIYVVDTSNHVVRKITSTGVMTILAGAVGVAGYADATGPNARFNSPSGIAVDSAGNVFVAEVINPVVRKITPAGVVTTVAGAAGVPFVPGFFPDGVGSSARFYVLTALAIGADDTVYIGEVGAVRKGVVVPSAAKVSIPPQDQIVSAGERTTFSVGANGFPAVSYQWQRAVSGSAVWVNLADVGLFSGATTSVLAINGVTPGMSGDRFRCVVTNPLGTDTSAVVSLTVDPPVVVVPLRVSTLAGRAGTQGGADGVGANASFNGPTGIATDASGNVLVADTFGNRIRKITPAGTVTTLAGSGVAGPADGTGTAAQFRQPGAIAVDAQGNVFVADQPNDPYNPGLPVIRKITPAGSVTTFAQGSLSGPRFNQVNGLAFDRLGNLVVSCSAEGAVRYAPNGTVVTSLPPLRLPGNGGIAFDTAGNLYLADSVNAVIFKMTTDGLNSLVAGKFNTGGAADGRSAVARFQIPKGVAVDSAGSLYVVDTGNQSIRKITPTGMVSTVAAIKPTASQTNTAGATDGIGTTARFNQPAAIAIDRAGTLYIADTLNNTIRRAVPLDTLAVGQATELYAQSTEQDQPAAALLPLGESSPALSAGPRRAALGTGSSYQWFKDSVPITGATNATLRLAAVGLADQGRYAVQVTTSDGTSMSEAVALAVTGSRLVNLSIRSRAGKGAETLTVGFVVAGQGFPILIRGVGPGLAPFGVAGALANPRLELYGGGTLLSSNAGWGNLTDIVEASARVGAFALTTNSVDAAVLPTLESGAFTVQCSAGSDSGGVALVEMYDANLADAARSRLINVSARSRVGAGDEVMIAGFSIRGSAPRRVLLRGVGPTLGQFGVEGALPDPQLKLFDSGGTLRAQNDDWSDNTNAADIAGAALAVGAFQLAPQSKDAVLFLSLNPGTYSVQLAGAATGTGIALIEVYEAP